MVDVDPRDWSAPASVVFQNADSLSARRISVVVRYLDGRAAQSLPVDIEILAPDSLRTREPIVLRLTVPRRTPSPANEAISPYRTGVVFGRKGPYVFTFTPKDNAQGVIAIGVNIE